MLRVFIGNHGGAHGPRDGERRVVPHYAAFAFGAVSVGAFVLEERRLGEDAEAVREAARDVELFFVLSGESEAAPVPECRRAAAQVYDYVPDFAHEDGDEFALCVGLLIVEAAQDAARGK